MKLLLYCTKAKPYLLQNPDWIVRMGKDKYIICKDNQFLLILLHYLDNITLNGKIVAECDFEVEEIKYQDIENYNYDEILPLDKILEKSCLTKIDLEDYLNGNNGYAIHIKNLHIFDEPKELSDYYSIHNIGGMLLTDKLKKAPQNMQRVSIQEWEYGAMSSNDIAILISIRPEWLCKILNGEKTIEIRKKVLNEMKDEVSLKSSND